MEPAQADQRPSNGTAESAASSVASPTSARTELFSLNGSTSDQGFKRRRGRPPKKPHHLAAKASAPAVAADDFKLKGKKKAPAITAAASRPKRSSLGGTALASDPISPEPMERSQSAITPIAVPSLPSLPSAAALPASIPKVGRPSQAPSLEVFNRAPSADLTDILASLGRHPGRRPVAISCRSANMVQPSESCGHENAEASGSGSAAAPQTPVKSLRSTRHPAGHPAYDISGFGSPSNGLMPISSVASLSGSPYVRKTIKLGSKKGKGKAVEEHVSNQDFCASCGGIGTFLCCDGCPRSFHFVCLDPPLSPNQLPEEDDWFCNECKASKASYRRPPLMKGPFALLLRDIESQNPTQFALPPEIRNAFAGVTTRPDGSYADGVDVRAMKYDRNGVPEERDLYRLRNKGKVPLCYRCKTSAAPRSASGAVTAQHARRLIPCDYCDLYWHMDCVEPPMAIAPSSARKWQCPNHAQQVAPKRRTLRQGVEEITVRRPGHRNNGNIEVIGDDERKTVDFESIFINSKRYKVPEKVIHLDFWAKIGAKRQRSTAPAVPPAPTARTLFGSQSPLSTAPSCYTISEPSSPTVRSSGGPMDIDVKQQAHSSRRNEDGLTQLLQAMAEDSPAASGSTTRTANGQARSLGHSDVDMDREVRPQLSQSPSPPRLPAQALRDTEAALPVSTQSIDSATAAFADSATEIGLANGSPFASGDRTPLRVKLKTPNSVRALTPPPSINRALANGNGPPPVSPKVVLRMHRPSAMSPREGRPDGFTSDFKPEQTPQQVDAA